MSYRFTESQIQRLREYGDELHADTQFETEGERDRQFSKILSSYVKKNERGLSDIMENPRHHRLLELELKLSEALIEEGFTEVKTPSIISKTELAKMGITEDHPLYKQVFFIDDKRALRPMHAPNLYRVMHDLRKHTDRPVKIFEIGSCYRAESHSTTHLEEFTMLNLVDMSSEGDTVEKVKGYIKTVMDTVGLEYELVDEESDVYKQTIDVMVNGEEVCSAAVGPHVLDPAHDIHEPWCGAGFGLERLIMMRDGDGSVRRTGRAISYLNGYRI